jgi:hypothetical protein
MLNFDTTRCADPSPASNWQISVSLAIISVAALLQLFAAFTQMQVAAVLDSPCPEAGLLYVATFAVNVVLLLIAIAEFCMYCCSRRAYPRHAATQMEGAENKF